MGEEKVGGYRPVVPQRSWLPIEWSALERERFLSLAGAKCLEL